MKQDELDRAIEQANRIFSRRYVRALEMAESKGVLTGNRTLNRGSGEDGWLQECRAAERRFGQPHARLFPLLGRKVRTPAGPGTLLQVFADRVTVLLDSELSKCSIFSPGEIEPITEEWPE